MADRSRPGSSSALPGWPDNATDMVDVAVVGAGLGGLSATMRVAEAGRSVVLLEAAPVLGGTCRYSGGGIHIWGARTWAEYRAHCPLADETLAHALFDAFGRYVDWLVASGAPGRYGVSSLRGLTLEKYQIGRSIAPHHRAAWLSYIADRSRRLGAQVRTGARVIALRRCASTRPHGGFALELDTGERFLARAVILAAGGFAADHNLMAQHVGVTPSAYAVRTTASSRGDGLALAESVGASRSRSMSTIYGHLMPAPPFTLDWTQPLDPILSTAFYAEHAIAVNAAGKRFVNEGAGELNGETANAAIREHQGAGLWVIFDETTRREHARYELPVTLLRPTNLRYRAALRHLRLVRRDGRFRLVVDSLTYVRRRGARVLREAAIGGLTEQLSAAGMDGRTAAKTISTYNSAVRAGNASALSVPRTGAPRPIESAPFYGVEVVAGVSMTYGGVRIDEHAHALDENDEPVPGLFAVPGTAGGIHNLHYAGALAACGVFGMIAAERAVLELRTSGGV